MCVCVLVCVHLFVYENVCVSSSVEVWQSEQTHSLDLFCLQKQPISSSLTTSYTAFHAAVCLLRVCVCAWGVKEQRVSEFSCLIMRVHKMNDGMHHGAICAHMGSLAFWLMCVHACVWMKCTIDSPSLACPICFWRSASWEMTERRNLCVCIFFTQPHTLIKISLPGMVHSLHIQAIR